MIAKLHLPLLPTLKLPALPKWARSHRLGAEELKSMSDHELRDLGVGRSQVEWALDHGRDDSPATSP